MICNTKLPVPPHPFTRMNWKTLEQETVDPENVSVTDVINFGHFTDSNTADHLLLESLLVLGGVKVDPSENSNLSWLRLSFCFICNSVSKTLLVNCILLSCPTVVHVAVDGGMKSTLVHSLHSKINVKF